MWNNPQYMQKIIPNTLDNQAILRKNSHITEEGLLRAKSNKQQVCLLYKFSSNYQTLSKCFNTSFSRLLSLKSPEARKTFHSSTPIPSFVMTRKRCCKREKWSWSSKRKKFELWNELTWRRQASRKVRLACRKKICMCSLLEQVCASFACTSPNVSSSRACRIHSSAL